MSLEVTELRAIAHPIRLRMLSLLTGDELSAAELARELGITHANASYHVRVLAAAGRVVEVGEVKIRGGTAKRYRHPWEQDVSESGQAVNRNPGSDELLYESITVELMRRQRLRLPGSPGVTVDAELWVSPDVWSRVRDLVREASVLIHEQAQPPHTEATVHVNLTAALFQLTDPPQAATGSTASRT